MTDPRAVPPVFDPDASITHVKYEYDMAVATATLLSSGRDRSIAETYALLESFLVHARNLHDFFRPRSEAALANRENPRHITAGSVWAHDFVTGFGVETFDAEAIATINRWLQHLTTWRQNHDDHPGWSPSMLADIYRSMDEFLDALPNQWHRELLRTTHQAAADLLHPAGLV
jgi:hypothetical protein